MVKLHENDPILVNGAIRVFQKYLEDKKKIQFYTVIRGVLTTKVADSGSVAVAKYDALTPKQHETLKNIKDYLRLRRVE